MTRARSGSWLLGVAVCSLLASTPVFAISPSYVVFYGDPLAVPAVFQVDPTLETGFLWSALARHDGSLQRGTLPRFLDGRPYVKFAVFWGRWPDGPGVPEEASQHGRLYLPTATAPATVVVESPWMVGLDLDSNPPAQPIPVDLDEHRDALGRPLGFVAGWILNAKELAAAKHLGIPGM
jgi:hypothetical protein